LGDLQGDAYVGKTEKTWLKQPEEPNEACIKETHSSSKDLGDFEQKIGDFPYVHGKPKWIRQKHV